MRFLLVSLFLIGACAQLERDDGGGRDYTLPPSPPHDVFDPGNPGPDAGVPDAPLPDGGTCEPECGYDQECGPDGKCWNGHCYERCWCDDDCSEGSRCVWGLCKPDK